MRYRWPPAKLCSATLRVITIFRGASAPIPSRLVLCDTKWWRYWQNSNSENCHHTEWNITNNCSKRRKSINNTANTKGVTYGLKREKKKRIAIEVFENLLQSYTYALMHPYVAVPYFVLIIITYYLIYLIYLFIFPFSQISTNAAWITLDVNTCVTTLVEVSTVIAGPASNWNRIREDVQVTKYILFIN